MARSRPPHCIGESRRAPRRMAIRAALVAAFVGISAPAAATVVILNFKSAEVARADACLKVVVGTDAASFASGLPSVSIASADRLTPEATPLLRQTVTFRGVQPERTISADALRIRNRCGRPVTVAMAVAPHGSDLAVDGQWLDLSMRLHLSLAQTAAPATDLSPLNAPAAAVAPGDTFTAASVIASWNQTPVRITASAGGAGTATAATSGAVTIANNSEIQVAIVTDAGINAVATDAILRTLIRADL
jgi:hypothetical protein